MNIYYDTESIGFSSPTVLIQWSDKEDKEHVELHEIMFTPIRDTLQLIEYIAENTPIGFNLSHDQFHLQRTYNHLAALASVVGEDREPIDVQRELVAVEKDSRDGLCVRPHSAVDLMLVARKGSYQTTMDRKAIRLRRVPVKLAEQLSKELGTRIPLPDILFARTKNGTGSKWKHFPVTDWATGKPHTEFVDIVLKFNPSTALKLILIDAGLRPNTRLKYEDVESAEMKKYKLKEFAWAPFALSVSTEAKDWRWEKKGKTSGWAWPKLLEMYSYHYRYNKDARTYAAEDVTDLKLLHDHFGSPEPDRDSTLACMAGSVRWKGFAIDAPKLTALRDAQLVEASKAPKAPAMVYKYVSEHMDADEETVLKTDKGNDSTKKVILETVSKWKKNCSCCVESKKFVTATAEDGSRSHVMETIYTPSPDCDVCKGSGKVEHPAALRAANCLEARQAANKVALFDKLLIAGRMHASASIVGSLSGRQSGRTEAGDGNRVSSLNALGIQNEKGIRVCFPMAFPPMQLNAGDFDSYEIAIAIAAWRDKKLEQQLLTCHVCDHVSTIEEFHAGETCPSCGAEECYYKLHGLFAMALFDKTYAEIIESKGTMNDMYKKGKGGVFSQMYGGTAETIRDRLGVTLEVAQAAIAKFFIEYKDVHAAQKRIEKAHCSMTQPNGVGTPVVWSEPADYVESLTGFRRYFTLENKITKELFDLAEAPPEEWLKQNSKVVRRDREQTVSGATRSAVFGAAFQIQAACMRAALNHEIQSTGADLTKDLQYELWGLQPVGVGEWDILTLNVHDEIVAPALPKHTKRCEEIVENFCVRNRDLVPFLAMTWSSNLPDWSDK